MGSRAPIIECWVTLTSFVYLLVQKLRYKSVGVTLHRVANFRLKHLNSDIEKTLRGIIILVLLFIQPILILLYRFSVKNTVSRPVFRVKIVIITPNPPTNDDFLKYRYFF